MGEGGEGRIGGFEVREMGGKKGGKVVSPKKRRVRGV